MILFKSTFNEVMMTSTVANWESIPSMTSIPKNTTDQNWGSGIFAKAWGKTTNTNPGPWVITSSTSLFWNHVKGVILWCWQSFFTGCCYLLMSQVSHCRKDAESAQKTSYGVDNHHNEGIPQDWSVKLVVRAECNKASKSDSNRVEHLCSCINPHLKVNNNNSNFPC